MGYSGIGGQAVMEGVMMKNGKRYAVAVRKPDGEVIVDTGEYSGLLSEAKVDHIPFVRGIVNFTDSLFLGMKTLMYSAAFYEEDEPDRSVEKKTGKNTDAQKQDENKVKEKNTDKKNTDKKKEDMVLTGTVAVSILAAIVIFMLIPYFISGFFQRLISSRIALALLEGVVRLGIFFAYILLISRMEDIQRVFMYHGAEHKCINCIEHGMELTVENVRKSSRLHKRCGTSFLFLVMCISIVFFLFIRTDSGILRIVIRLLLIPFIAATAYEFIRLAGRSDSWLASLPGRPGLALQKFTTREPDDSMIEVAIASVEAVFDWKAYLEELHDI